MHERTRTIDEQRLVGTRAARPLEKVSGRRKTPVTPKSSPPSTPSCLPGGVKICLLKPRADCRIEVYFNMLREGRLPTDVEVGSYENIVGRPAHILPR